MDTLKLPKQKVYIMTLLYTPDIQINFKYVNYFFRINKE